ncbi:MAG: glutamine synthetase [Eubacteriales bacterium]|nr:glutamine synthetase [Clostridiales bacterium]
MPTEFRRAFDEGISFDASAIAGYSDIVQSNLLLRPDPSTLSSVPWLPIHGRMVRMYCSIHLSRWSAIPS